MKSTAPTVTDSAHWERERLELLEAEKAHMRAGDALAERRRALPWVPIDTDYTFSTESGARSLHQLFEGRSQLVVMHFMFGPDWEEGCPSCSFWADNYDGTLEHLKARDVTFVVASTAPLEQLLAYRTRMGWSFPWVSAAGSSFNLDFEVAGSQRYNYRAAEGTIDESPGLSVFAQRDGSVFHTYSTYARGLEAINATYHLLDLVPKGRDEVDLPWTMAWLRRHDSY